jgi:uncharacterized membrane protein
MTIANDFDASEADAIPSPRLVPFEAPWAWLASGWRDLWDVPALSLGYGAAFALAAAALAASLTARDLQAIFPVLAGGFLIVGPLAAVGLYEASRRLAVGENILPADMFRAGKLARGQLLYFGAMLLFAYLLWVRIALLLLALFLGATTLPPPSEFIQLLLFTPAGLGLLIVGSMVGGGIAAVIFAVSAVSVPMLLVRRTDVVTAARASIAAITKNPKPMALWAALVVALMAAGFATLLVGLVVVFPLIGHATWHAYADIYGPPKSSTPASAVSLPTSTA